MLSATSGRYFQPIYNSLIGRVVYICIVGQLSPPSIFRALLTSQNKPVIPLTTSTSSLVPVPGNHLSSLSPRLDYFRFPGKTTFCSMYLYVVSHCTWFKVLRFYPCCSMVELTFFLRLNKILSYVYTPYCLAICLSMGV